MSATLIGWWSVRVYMGGSSLSLFRIFDDLVIVNGKRIILRMKRKFSRISNWCVQWQCNELHTKKKRFASANNDDHTLMVQCDRQGRNGMTQLYEFISGVGSRRSIVWLFNKIQRANGCNDHPHEEGIRDHWLVRPLLLERFHFISTAALFLSPKFNWWWNTFWWTLMAFSQITLSASHSCLLLELLVATRKKSIHELLDP